MERLARHRGVCIGRIRCVARQPFAAESFPLERYPGNEVALVPTAVAQHDPPAHDYEQAVRGSAAIIEHKPRRPIRLGAVGRKEREILTRELCWLRMSVCRHCKTRLTTA